ncbi:MAG: hypothetical protein AAF388_24740, partial [Bacteroidota bacterium]
SSSVRNTNRLKIRRFRVWGEGHTQDILSRAELRLLEDTNNDGVGFGPTDAVISGVEITLFNVETACRVNSGDGFS